MDSHGVQRVWRKLHRRVGFLRCARGVEIFESEIGAQFTS